MQNPLKQSYVNNRKEIEKEVNELNFWQRFDNYNCVLKQIIDRKFSKIIDESIKYNNEFL